VTGRPRLWGWWSGLSLASVGVSGGGCGWVEHNVWSKIFFGVGLTCGVGVGFGALLGPERTPDVPGSAGGGWVFVSGCSWAGPSNASRCAGFPVWVGVVVVVSVLGCGCVLSVA
jgi:hypothetical protein